MILLRILVIAMLGLNVIYISLLVSMTDHAETDGIKYNQHNQIGSRFALGLLIVMSVLLTRMCFMVFTLKYHEIDWDGTIFSDNYNIMHSYYMIQVVYGGLGGISGHYLLQYYLGTLTKTRMNLFISFGFAPFLLVSLPNYLKYGTTLLTEVATVIAPKRMIFWLTIYFQKYPPKIFMESKPECCICYEDEKCCVNRCGHLICSECVIQIKNSKCPLCRMPIRIIAHT